MSCVGRGVRGLTLAGCVVALGVLPGCGKRVASLLTEYAADYAAVDKMIGSANGLVAKVPERGTKAFPRCKYSPTYVFDPNGKANNTDVIGRVWLARGSTPLGEALALRTENAGKGGRFSGPKSTPSQETALKSLKNIKNLIVVREHKDSSDDHVSADIFLFASDSSKIVCAVGFDGGPPSYGSVGQVVGKETISMKKTGKVIAVRDVVEGASSGTSGAGQAAERFPRVLARNLGIALDYSVKDASAIAQKGGEPPGLGSLPALRIRYVLEDRSATKPRDSWSKRFCMMNVWDTDGLHIELYDAELEPNLAIGREHAVLVGGATGRSIADRLAAISFASQKDLVASLKSVGLRLSGPLPPEPKFVNGVRLHSLATKSGSTDVRVDVLDYAEAAQKKGGSTARFEGRKVLILSGSSPIVGTPEEVATEIMGK